MAYYDNNHTIPTTIIGVIGTLTIGLLSAVSSGVKRILVHIIVFALYFLTLLVVVLAVVNLTTLKLSRLDFFLVLFSLTITCLLVHIIFLFRMRRNQHETVTEYDNIDIINRYEDWETVNIKLCVSVADYRSRIVKYEGSASSLHFIQFRIPPHHLSEKSIQSIADSRYGEGSLDRENYIDGQISRKKTILRHLEDGKQLREIFSRDQLLKYVHQGGRLSSGTRLSPSQVVEALKNWISLLEKYPTYQTGISVGRTPLKYHLLSPTSVVLHEPVHRLDFQRINSMFIESESLARQFELDFERIWTEVSPVWRDRNRIIEWIKSDLIPLALSREVDDD